VSVGIESCDESVGHGRWSRIMALMAISSLRATAASAAFFDSPRLTNRS